MTDPVGAEVQQIIERLTTEFDRVPPDEVARTVKEEQAQFADARIWEFVPLLVERASRRRLAQTFAQPSREQVGENPVPAVRS